MALAAVVNVIDCKNVTFMVVNARAIEHEAPFPAQRLSHRREYEHARE